MEYTNKIHPNKVRQFIFLAIIIFLFIVIWQQMYFMLAAFLGAMALYTLTRGIMYKLIIHYKWPRWLVALFLIISSLIIIIMPFAWIISILINKLQPYVANPKAIYNLMGGIDSYLQDKFHLKAFTEKNIQSVIQALTSLVPKLLGSTLATITNIGIMYFILYFMIIQCDVMEAWIRRHLPLKSSNNNKVLTEVRAMVLNNAIGIPVLAVIQGIVSVIGYMIFGVNEPILWGIITGLCSVVPIIGTMAAWVPIDLYLFSIGNEGAGIGILFWGLLAIGLSDNIFRFMLQKRLGNVHPLITVFGVIIGVNIFGFVGLIYGPLLISMFILLVKIYADEFASKSVELVDKNE